VPVFQVSQLEVEIQGIPLSIKAPYTGRLKQAKADLMKYKRLSKDLHSQAARTDLLGGHKPATAGSDDPYDEQSDRTRLLVGTESLNDGSRRITESTSIALETEAHGADILRTLRGQRDQIENSRNMVYLHVRPTISVNPLFQLHTADTHVDRASGTIKGMIRQ
jgi:vesicle transport through interaction with t-SNAREs protein 1